MLNFFRKYQKFIFLFTTIVIVMTFAFFGTYRAFAPSHHPNAGSNEVAFRTIDRKKVRRSYLNQMVQFLNTENWMQPAKPFDVNFLNDGFISNEFLESRFATFIAASKEELLEKLEKEKKYTPYTHPYARHLTARSIWEMFAPDIPEKLALLQQGEDPLETFNARIELFLAERRFPSAFLTQVIRYQERDNPNIPADQRLMRENPSLFGYHNLSDWFGEHFMEEICRAVMNTAAYARSQGYKVSREEVMTDLLYRSQTAYENLKQRINLPVNNGYGLFQLYLRQMGFDEETVVKVWEDAMLFRRLLGEIGDAALTDSLALQNFYAYAHENVTIELYQMPSELRFQNDEDLKKFETYLELVGTNWDLDVGLPLDYAKLEAIEERAPELVGKRYRLFIGEVSKESLHAKVSMKETWEWESQPENWEKLKAKFPELVQQTGAPFEILEKMDSKGRKRVDVFARQQIVEMHPEWIEFSKIQMKEKDLFLTSKTVQPLAGITDPIQLREMLDKEDEINGYTQDQKHFYRILVCDRSDEKEVLSFTDAKKFLEGNVEPKRKPESRFADYLKKYSHEIPSGTLAKQWKVEKKQKTLTRSESSFISLDEVIAMENGSLSEVKTADSEGAYFYRFIDKKNDTTLPTNKMAEIQQILAQEARQHYFKHLMSQWNESL